MFLGWWIFGNVYADTLTPTSARQIATFRDYFEAFQNEPENDKHRAAVAYQSRKRLPVALFDTPSNHVMIQRLGDDDTSVSDWLRRQQLGSDWSARRTLILNQREIHESSFTYNYLCYRLDLGLALPVRDNVDEVIPTELLPQPVGRKHMRRFFQPRQMPRRQRRLGVSRWIDHAAIPGNCMYFHDLRTIANISCYSPKEHAGTLESLQSGGWEAQLADKWFELIEDRRESAEDEHLLRYFREIVCESLRHTEHISTATLINELDPPDIYQKQLFSIYEHFITDEIGAFTATSLERRKLWLGAFPGGHREVELKETNKQLDEEFEATPGFLPRLFKTDETLDTDLDEAASWSPRAPRRMIALYSALITDLRRAWQAMRLYGAARVVMGGVTPDGGSETGSIPSLSVIANRDRMQLYKRNDIENLLKRSPWILELLKVFDQENIHKTFVEWEKKKGQSLKVATDIGIPEIQRIFEARDGLEEQVQSEEEPRDFRSWTRTLRAIGRSVCHRWPAHHVDKDGTEFEVDLENDLFANANSDDPKAHLLKIFDKLEKEPSGSEPKFRNATEAKEYEDKRKAYNNERRRQNARSARNFVWLMYGLAPSLPAVIHAHIMSQIYEAELNVRAFKDATRAGRSSYLYKQKDKFAKQARELYSFESEKNSDSGSKANKRRLGAIQEVEEWAKLIGTLSIMLRYIKIKCLHLDTTLIFREKTEQNPDEIIALLERTKFTIATPKRPDKDASQAERDAFEEKDKHWREKFRDLFSKKVCEQFTEERIADGLAIFPDVSPSTLFGDDWLTDILSRRGLSQSLLKSMSGSSLEYRITGLPPENKDGEDDPLSVNGIFGETEQWLWSANRTLRKLRAKLQKRYTAVDIALGSTGGGISDPPASPSSASVEGTQQPGASIANTQQPPTA